MRQIDNKKKTSPRNAEYTTFIDAVKARVGVGILSDKELIALAFDDISHTFTRDERNYS